MENQLQYMKKKELQKFLRNCGQPTFGNKPELLERARGAKSLGLDVTDESNSMPVLKDIMLSPLGENLPPPSELKTGWLSDCGTFPDFTDKDLYNYLVLSRHRTFDDNLLSARRQLKAKVFYQEGHVQMIMYHQISEKCSHCFVKCECLPSIPTRDRRKKPAYQTWVCLSKVTGRVHTAECNCVAGAGESCSHIAALLYGLADITSQKSTGKIAPTSKACEWIKPRSRILSPKKSQDMVFSKFKTMSSKVPVCDVNATKTVDLTNATVASFRDKLQKANPNAAWLKNFSANSQRSRSNVALPKLHKINFCYMNTVDLHSVECVDFFSSYFDSLNITNDHCTLINELTEGQSVNLLWTSARFGRLTASIFGNIVRRKPDTPPENIIKYILGYNVPFSGSAVSWGKKHEKVAINSYMVKAREIHPPLTVNANGLIVNEHYPHLGASPDGLVYCSHCSPYHGVLEVKCPYRFRDIHPLEAAKDVNFFCMLNSTGKLYLKRTHAYYYQIQGQLAITKREWCDFVVWTNKGLECERIYFDNDLWVSVILPKLNAFFCSAVLPELFSNRVKRGLKLHVV